MGMGDYIKFLSEPHLLEVWDNPISFLKHHLFHFALTFSSTRLVKARYFGEMND